MELCLVILNYNDAGSAIDAARRARDIGIIEHIILVDNASTDGSPETIAEALKDTRLKGAEFIEAADNGGYGSGNNLGVRYAAELGAKYALIANPDSYYDERTVSDMLSALRNDPMAAAAGAVMLKEAGADNHEGPYSYGEYLSSGWKERGLMGEIIHSGPILKRIFKRFINYSPGYYEGAAGSVGVYAVHGSLVMVDIDKFLGVGGFDEELFLYEEEYALGARLKSAGYTSLLVRTGYRHAGGQSICGAGLSAVARQKLRRESELIYYRKYLGAGPLGLAAARMVGAVVLAETKLLYG